MRLQEICITIGLLPGIAFGATPAETKIEAAKVVVQKPSANSESHTDLAWAYIKRARETSDAQFYRSAENAIQTALKMSPDNFEAQKAICAILLARGEYFKALDLARNLNKRTPDDVLVYGFIADASIALGKIDEAEKAAQWMLDLRPGNVPGMLRGAELRRIFGDPEGALDWLGQAYRRVSPEETEERAYILTRISEVQISNHNVKAAITAAEQSLKLFPDYPLGRRQLERARAAAEATPPVTSKIGEKQSSTE